MEGGNVGYVGKGNIGVLTSPPTPSLSPWLSSQEEIVEERDHAKEDANDVLPSLFTTSPLSLSWAASTAIEERISFHSSLHFRNSPVSVCRLRKEHFFCRDGSMDRI